MQADARTSDVRTWTSGVNPEPAQGFHAHQFVPANTHIELDNG